jgi:hypothetical protein
MFLALSAGSVPMLRPCLVLAAVLLIVGDSSVPALAKGGGGIGRQQSDSSGGARRHCTYDRCYDRCMVKRGMDQFSNAKCAQRCVKRGCTGE